MIEDMRKFTVHGHFSEKDGKKLSLYLRLWILGSDTYLYTRLVINFIELNQYSILYFKK